MSLMRCQVCDLRCEAWKPDSTAYPHNRDMRIIRCHFRDLSGHIDAKDSVSQHSRHQWCRLCVSLAVTAGASVLVQHRLELADSQGLKIDCTSTHDFLMQGTEVHNVPRLALISDSSNFCSINKLANIHAPTVVQGRGEKMGISLQHQP